MTIKQSLLFILLLLTAIGCGNKVPLRGKVVFSDDQSPVTRGSVLFTAGAYQARGDIQPDGGFQVASLKKNDGLPPGTYVVSLTGVDRPSGKIINGVETRVSMIDEKYESGKTSDLTLQVDRSTRFYEIKVDRK